MRIRSKSRSKNKMWVWPVVLPAILIWIAPALGSPVKPDETVLFLSGLGHPQTDGWDLEIHGWIYESEFHKPLTSLFRHAIGIRDDELTPAEQATFRERAQFFLVDNERNKSVRIQL